MQTHAHSSQPKLSSCPANPQQLIEKRGYELHRKWKPLKGINEGEAEKNLCGLPISPIKLLNNGYLTARHFISRAVCVACVCHHDTKERGIWYWPGTHSHDQGNPGLGSLYLIWSPSNVIINSLCHLLAGGRKFRQNPFGVSESSDLRKAILCPCLLYSLKICIIFLVPALR